MVGQHLVKCWGESSTFNCWFLSLDNTWLSVDSWVLNPDPASFLCHPPLICWPPEVCWPPLFLALQSSSYFPFSNSYSIWLGHWAYPSSAVMSNQTGLVLNIAFFYHIVCRTGLSQQHLIYLYCQPKISDLEWQKQSNRVWLIYNIISHWFCNMQCFCSYTIFICLIIFVSVFMYYRFFILQKIFSFILFVYYCVVRFAQYFTDNCVLIITLIWHKLVC